MVDTDRPAIDDFLQRRMETLDLIYRQIINRLWLAQGASSGVIISFLSSHGDKRYNSLLWPLGMFIIGLGLLVLGDLAQMIKDARAVKRNQSAFSYLDILLDDVEAPIERLGMKGFRLW